MTEYLDGSLHQGQAPALCRLCGRPLDDTRGWQLAIDGTGVHDTCLSEQREQLTREDES